MKITSFDPIIVTNKSEEIKKIFEALGFKKTHTPVVTRELETAALTRMKHENGYHIDIVTTNRVLPHDMMSIRINVDDFEEAYNLLTSHGFKIAPDDSIIETESAKMAIMDSPSGFTINIMQHIKDQD